MLELSEDMIMIIASETSSDRRETSEARPDAAFKASIRKSFGDKQYGINGRDRSVPSMCTTAWPVPLCLQ